MSKSTCYLGVANDIFDAKELSHFLCPEYESWEPDWLNSSLGAVLEAAFGSR